MEPIVLSEMTSLEARVCVDRINSGMSDIRTQLLELKEREGWKALGYSSWRECAVAEFDYSQSRVYQLLDAAQIERDISTIVENGETPEGHLRELAPLKDHPTIKHPTSNRQSP